MARREWYPALRAADLDNRDAVLASAHIRLAVDRRRRHLFELSRFMGTSPAMLDKTYGHLLPDAVERGRTALDSFLETKPAEAFGH